MSSQPSILVIDDEPNNFDVIEMLLLRDGYNLDYATSGLEALKYLDAYLPSVILLDVMMPDINGIELCQQIKAHPVWQPIPVIMVTALNSKEDLARCLDAGADDFVSKPVNGTELRARVRSMLRIKQQHDALQATLQLREDMSNMIVHDLRNPLSSILLAGTVLQLMHLPEKPQRKLDQIMVAGQQLQSLIDSLLVIAKLEAGKLLLHRTEVDLCEIGTAALFDFEAIAAQKRIQLNSQLPEPGESVWVDASLLRRVLDNLLSNAIKFSPCGSQVRLQIDYLAEGHAKIQVADSGSGISPELRQCIFEKYEVGRFLQDVSQTGLGLAFCKMAITAHDGSITVTENQPNGSIFTVEI
ncbi:hybrid sensor histidine kinase/response regulator [Pantanalinema rosaneae CENA516]|uniref:hybrid sensor histidine kinase/response regulator n=1 Tax=Pantanalinema rosaneae TaxID=1620701 RepID=UPI003D6E4808